MRAALADNDANVQTAIARLTAVKPNIIDLILRIHFPPSSAAGPAFIQGTFYPFREQSGIKKIMLRSQIVDQYTVY
jgi:hypothetical protein